MTTFVRLTWVELKLFAREPFSLVFTFAFPLVALVVLAGIFGSDPAGEMAEGFGGVAPSDYYLAGYLGVVVSAIGLIALPVHVAAYRERGILRRFRASSVPAWSIVAAQAAVGLVMATLGSIVLVLAGRLLYDASLPESVEGVVLAFLVSTLSFLAVGFLLGSLARSARAAQALGMILFFPMWLLSGAGPPPDILTEGMRRVSDVLPLTYAVRALQGPWLGGGSSPLDLLLLTGILLVAGTLSIRSFRSV